MTVLYVPCSLDSDASNVSRDNSLLLFAQPLVHTARPVRDQDCRQPHTRPRVRALEGSGLRV